MQPFQSGLSGHIKSRLYFSYFQNDDLKMFTVYFSLGQRIIALSKEKKKMKGGKKREKTHNYME